MGWPRHTDPILRTDNVLGSRDGWPWGESLTNHGSIRGGQGTGMVSLIVGQEIGLAGESWSTFVIIDLSG